MIITPKDMKIQAGINTAKQNLLERQSGIVCNLPAPAPVKKPCGKKLRRRQRLDAKLREKKRARPMFSAELCEPPQAVLHARAAFAKAAKSRNPRPSAPILEIVRPAESDSGSPVSTPSGVIIPPPASGIALNPDNGEPLSNSVATALKLVKHLDKKAEEKAVASRTALLRGFRKGKTAAYTEARSAFEKSLETLRDNTRARMDTGIVKSTAPGETVSDTFKTAEAKMVMSAKNLLEKYLGRSVPVYTANLHREAIDNYFTATKKVHAEVCYPVAFGDAPRDFSGSFERSYYGMLVKAGVKEVEIVGGRQDRTVMNIRVAAMLRSYELLIPALDTDV